MAPQPDLSPKMPLLRTKLYVPAPRPDLVSRPRLISSLNAGLWHEGGSARKLTLISAPAGFGKTTVVTEWIQGLQGATPPVAVAWLSLDEGDNDATHFLSYVIAALRTLDAGIGTGMMRALQSPQPPPVEAVLTGLINEISGLSGYFMLVLDDYHLVDAQIVHDGVAFLLRHLPPQLHIVVTTREDPLLPLARLRARGQVTELRAADLRFTSDEAADFLNRMMGLTLSAADITALETRTEGWIAGLQLAALALQGLAPKGSVSAQGRHEVSSYIRSFSGSHRFVLDYLVEEVLEQQSEEIQAFLLQTSILDRLTGPLCDALRWGEATSPVDSGGTTHGQEILAALEHANLFVVPLDDERRWYRYHHLFADLLQQRLRQSHADWEPGLHLRASAWYEQNGFVDDAVEHALRGRHYARAARLIEGRADTMWHVGDHTKLQRWLTRLPDACLSARPQLCIYHAWFLFSVGQEAAAERTLQAAEQALEAHPSDAATTPPPGQAPLSTAARIKVSGRLGAIRAVMGSWQRAMPRVIQHAREALESLPPDDPWRNMAVVTLGDAYYFRGDVVAAYQFRLEALQACDPDDLFSLIIANLKVATSLRELGQLQETIEICRQQVAFAHEHGLSQTIFEGWAKALWGLSLADRNELDEALALATQGVDLTRGGDLGFSGFSRIVFAQVLFHREDFTGAADVLRELIRNAQHLPFWISEAATAWQARLWLAQGQVGAAVRWGEERGLDADGARISPPNYMTLVLARILLAQGKPEEATRLLDRLLEATEPGGHTARLIEILALRALAHQATGHSAEGLVDLKRALALAEPGGYVRVFVDGGPPMSQLLTDARRYRVATDYVTRLLAAFPGAEPAQPSQPEHHIQPPGLLEPLSERELEVLQLIAQGLTNREIGSKLFLTLNTVKAHTRNLYGKLDVHSRTQAVVRAQTLGLLPTE